MSERLRGLALVVGSSFRASPGASLVILILTVAQALATPAFAVAAGLLVDAAATRDGERAMAMAFVLAGSVGARWVLGASATYLTARLQREVARLLDGHLIATDGRLPGLEHHERPAYLAQLDLLRDEHWMLGFALGAAVGALALAVQLVATSIVLLRLQPALVILPLCGIPSLVAAGRAQRRLAAADEVVVESVRRERSLFDLGTSPTAAKELRVFGLGDEIVRRRHVEADSVITARHVARRASALGQAIGRLIFAAGYLAAVAIVAVRAVAGAASVGDVVVVVSLAGQVWGLVGGAAGSVTWLLSILRVVNRIRWLDGYARDQTRSPADPAAAPSQLRHGIDLVGVDFSYPDTDRPVLEDVNLHLPARATVALVGDNGAGKSTLVKLLCRFYEPTAGRVEVDGIDLARIGMWAWRERLAGAFQDYARLTLTARESVGVGDVPVLQEDTDAPELAALARAGATDVLDALPHGLATPLGSGYAGAVDLSGGQWQKIALGRARMRPHPLLLVLDEPTSALDPGAEHALFERFAGAARDVRAHGGITLLVSHRFSTVRMADLIVVVDGRCVREVGTHEQLMAHHGVYAELYTMQARAYASTVSKTD